MATNFPSSLDTNTELGGVFLDAAPPVNPLVDIAAAFRNNINDAMFAVQARVGIDASANTGSLSWATLSAGGTNNLGLRFASSSATWPGAVGESGLFLKNTSLEVAFHRAGEAVGTFHILAGATLQSAYNGGNAIVTSGGDDIEISGSESVVISPAVTKKLHLDGPVSHTGTDGILDVDYSVGSDGAAAVTCSTMNIAGHNGYELTGFAADLENRSDLDSMDIITNYKSELVMSGDGPVLPSVAIGAHFYAGSSSFTGAGGYYKVGFLVDSSNDLATFAFTGGSIYWWQTDGTTEKFEWIATNVTGGITADGIIRASVKFGDTLASGIRTVGSLESIASGGDQLGGTLFKASASTSSSPLAATGDFTCFLAEQETSAGDDATAWSYGYKSTFSFASTGGGVYDDGPSAVGIYLDLPESYQGGIYHNNDGLLGFYRWAINVRSGESSLRRTYFSGPTDLAKALVELDQTDDDQPFIDFEGAINADPTLGNITTTNGGGAVVGPQSGSPGWVFYGMYKVEVNGSVAYTPLFTYFP